MTVVAGTEDPLPAAGRLAGSGAGASHAIEPVELGRQRSTCSSAQSTVALGYVMLAASTIPIADGTIVLRAGGPKAIAYCVHWATAGLILITAALLIT